MQLNLGVAGIDPGPAPISGRGCRAYAEGLPQPHSALGSMPDAGVNSPTGLEFFATTPGGGGVVPLRLASYPNMPAPPSEWAHILHSTTVGPFNRTAGPDAATLGRMPSWLSQFREDPGSIYVHEYNRVGWADMHWVLEGLTLSNLTFGGCGNMSIGEHLLLTGNYFYVYNVAAELDQELEYYINRTSKILYAWLPWSGHSGSDLAGYASLQEAPLLALDSVTGGLWRNASFMFGRGAGISCVNCTGVSVEGAEVAFLGLMAANISGGSRVSLVNVSVHDVGNGGVYLYAGDRATLSPANHLLDGATVTRYNRYTHCYTPGVTLGGVGNTVTRTHIFNAPHQAIFLSGNEHTISDCDIHEVTQITSDSGAFYMGRDLTYRGNRLLRNAWHDINSVNAGTPILYLDDCASSVAVINNTFWNCSGPTAASEGGMGHSFIGNYVSENAMGVHALGKSCAGALQYASLVPWNTSSAWRAAYPELVEELRENANAPWHLTFLNNTRCVPTANSSAAAPFVDMNIASVQRWNGSSDGGINACHRISGVPTPPWTSQPVRGFNSWTAFGCGVTDADLRATADSLVELGLAKAGYTIVAPDDCWASSRGSDGTIIPDKTSFPSGMAPVAQYIFSRGLSFGMYSAIGNETCAHRPGSAGFEAVDARTYASWGVTWLKLDNCDYPGWDPAELYARWASAFDALPYRIALATKAVINYTTALQLGAASRRVGGDVSASWTDLLGLAYMAEPLWKQARVGSSATNTSSFFTDIELLQVGNGKLTAAQQEAHFYLWCAMHAPLMLSTKLSALSTAQVQLLTNAEALAINHDLAGAQAHRLSLQQLTSSSSPPTSFPKPALALACSLGDSPAPSPGQAWVRVPIAAAAAAASQTPSTAFLLQLAQNKSLCLQRPHCGGDSTVVVDLCSSASCEGGKGSQWEEAEDGSQQLRSLSSGGGCLSFEPRVQVVGCARGPSAYQSLTFNNQTSQLVMNFTGSGALGDYTGYPQCLDVMLATSGEVWGANLSDGSISILALNPTAAAANITINSTALARALGHISVGGFQKLRAVRDVGARVSLSNASSVFLVQVESEGARFLKVTPT